MRNEVAGTNDLGSQCDEEEVLLGAIVCTEYGRILCFFSKQVGNNCKL